jgi:hypothetical protein
VVIRARGALMEPAGQSVAESAGEKTARFPATRVGADRAAAPWSGRRRLPESRRRLGMLLVVAGLGLMAGGGWLIVAG